MGIVVEKKEKLSGSVFKDSLGRLVYFPFFHIAKGRVLPDSSAALRIQKATKACNIIGAVGFLMLKQLEAGLDIDITVVFCIFWVLAFYVLQAAMVVSFPRSDMKITYRDLLVNRAQVTPSPLLWFKVLLSAIFLLAGGVLFTFSENTKDIVIASFLITYSCILIYSSVVTLRAKSVNQMIAHTDTGASHRIQMLESLSELLKTGSITEEEFQSEKSKILKN